jgi:hypothetical protein
MFPIAPSVVAEQIRAAILARVNCFDLQQNGDLQQWYAACNTRLRRPRPKTWI